MGRWKELTEADKSLIVNLNTSGESLLAISKRFGVGIGRIKRLLGLATQEKPVEAVETNGHSNGNINGLFNEKSTVKSLVSFYKTKAKDYQAKAEVLENITA